MSLTAASYARQLAQLLPQGALWDLETGSVLRRLLLGVGEELRRIASERGATLVDEMHPPTTFELVPEWERVLGLPDPCVGTDQTLAQRRQAIAGRLSARGGQSRAYFIALAARLGFTITITEFRVYSVDDDVDTPVYGTAWAYAWQVNGLEYGERGYFAVDSPASEPLSWWGVALLECVFSRVKPAHTTVLFAYT